MLVGDSGSGERCTVASSREGGEALVRVSIPRAKSAAARVCFSLSSLEAVSARARDADEMADVRDWILA